MRGEQRRRARERQAVEMNALNEPTEADWRQLAPVLDEAMDELDEAERDALVLRYFEQRELRAVGAALGVSDDTAQKRVSRALHKLREHLSRRGVRSTASALPIVLSANAVQAAPLGFAASLTVTVLTSVPRSSTAPFSKLLAMINMKTAILTIGLVGAIVALGIQQINTHHQLRAAQASVAEQAGEIQALRTANEQLLRQANELNRLREEAKDVLRLRAEIARLRLEQAALEKLASQAAQTGTNIPVKEPAVLITAKFISVPTKELGDVVWVRAVNGGSDLMDDYEVRSMVEALKSVSGAEFLSEPRIQTANDTPASLSATQEVPWNGTNFDVGETLHVEPHYSTNSNVITLDFAAELTRFIDTSSQQDESQRVLRTATITNSTSVVSGRSILLRQDLEDQGHVIGSTNTAAGPKSLLLVVTPTLVRDDGSVYRLQRVIKREEETGPIGR
jgi:hypothetical protein